MSVNKSRANSSDNIQSTFDSDNTSIIELHEGEYIPEGKPVMSLNFNNNSSSESNLNVQNLTNNTIQSNTNSKQTSTNDDINKNAITFTEKTNGKTPPRDDECFNIKRCYQFRPSTLQKLNKIKLNSNDLNLYLNEIIDDAICFYYSKIFGMD